MADLSSIIPGETPKINVPQHTNGKDPLPQVPSLLKEIPRWLPWKYTPDPNRAKPRKIPHQISGKWADTMRPEQWGTYDVAVQAHAMGGYSGLGFLLQAPVVGLDYDNCVVDGQLTAFGLQKVQEANSYTEISPSGRGIRIFVLSTWRPVAEQPQGLNRDGVELYFGKRFLTVTGRHIAGTPTTLQDRTAYVKGLYELLIVASTVQDTIDLALQPTPIPKDFLEQLRARSARTADRIESEAQAVNAGADLVESLYNEQAARVDRSLNDLSIAQWLLARGIEPGLVLSVLTHPTWFSGAKSRERGNDHYARTTIARALSIREERRRTVPDAQKHWTELGNAERLIEGYGNNLRYCAAKGGWLIWNGYCWLPDRTNTVAQQLQTVVRGLHAQVDRTGDFDLSAALKKWALQSESARVQKGTLELAQTLEGVSVAPEGFDNQPWHFPAANGIIDLRTGDLLPHAREYHFTTVSAIPYTPTAKAPRWRQALEMWLPDEEVRQFIQRAVGYTLTGVTSEQVFFFLHGAGSNGKSTFILVLQGIIGQMCRRIATEAVTLRSGGNPGTLRDQAAARLTGARMAVVSEIDQNARWAEGWLKDLTGGGVIATKTLYKDPGEALPTAKLWIDSNHEPRALPGAIESQAAETDSFWRRLREVPFRVPVTARDRVLDFHRVLLRDEGPGILAWMVEGCLEWQLNGLPVPTVVKAATDAYRQKEDTLRPFIDEWLVAKEGSRTTMKEVNVAYKLWASENGERPMPKRVLQGWLEERGFRVTSNVHGSWLEGFETTKQLKQWEVMGVN